MKNKDLGWVQNCVTYTGLLHINGFRAIVYLNKKSLKRLIQRS